MAQETQTATENMREEIRNQILVEKSIERAVGAVPYDQAIRIADVLGRAALKHELGDYGNWDGEIYRLDAVTRDRLLAHTRQDTALAFHVASEALRHSMLASKRAGQARWLSAAGLGASVALLGLFLLQVL